MKIELLDVDTNYDFRPSLTNNKKARCCYCQFYRGAGCELDNKVYYPTCVEAHNCQDYKYEKDEPSHKISENQILIFTGLMDKLAECNLCGNNLENRCTGIHWFPFKKDPKCEFFVNQDLICKNAVPYFQYTNHLRNNYCRLIPILRDGDMKNRSWECNCTHAHQQPKYYKCYKPKK